MAPGQFLHLRVPDPSKLLRRPISICQIDKLNKIATIVYRAERAGTAILSQLKAGDRVDAMGPQGNGFDLSVVSAGQTALLIGGGIGVPPLVETAKQLAAKGVKVISVLGFANKDAVILEDELSAYGEVYVTTDDGSYGIKGYVSTVVDELVEKQSFDAIYSCGAPGMLKYVDKKFENHPHAFCQWNLEWLAVWELATLVWFICEMLKKQLTSVSVKMGQSLKLVKSFYREVG